MMSGLPFPSGKKRDPPDVSTCSFHRRGGNLHLRNCLGRGSLGRFHVGRGRRGSLPGVGVGFLREVQRESFQVLSFFFVGGAYFFLFWSTFLGEVSNSTIETRTCQDIEWCLECSFVGWILCGKQPKRKDNQTSWEVLGHESWGHFVSLVQIPLVQPFARNPSYELTKNFSKILNL